MYNKERFCYLHNVTFICPVFYSPEMVTANGEWTDKKNCTMQWGVVNKISTNDECIMITSDKNISCIPGEILILYRSLIFNAVMRYLAIVIFCIKE